MNGISSISNTTVENSSNVTKSLQNELGKEEFLKLLVTQLRYQDPLSPMDNEAFIAQLAQFSSLEQMQNMNENLKTNIDTDLFMAQSISNSMVTALIDKEVKIQTNNFELSEGENVSFGYRLDQTSANTKINIYDSNGSLVYFEELGPENMGDHQFEWDGRNIQNNIVAPGAYRIEVLSVDDSEQEKSALTFISGAVEAVKYGSNGSSILVNNQLFNIGDVLEVRSKG